MFACGWLQPGGRVLPAAGGSEAPAQREAHSAGQSAAPAGRAARGAAGQDQRAGRTSTAGKVTFSRLLFVRMFTRCHLLKECVLHGPGNDSAAAGAAPSSGAAGDGGSSQR